jgi:hypothetical protein
MQIHIDVRSIYFGRKLSRGAYQQAGIGITSAMPVRCNGRNKNYKCKMQDIFWKNELTNQNKDIYFGSNHFFLTHSFQKYGIDDFATKFKS